MNNEKKFLVRPSNISSLAYDSYIKFVGDNINLPNDKFINDFKSKFNLGISRTSRVLHVEILDRNINTLILQTSTFNTITSNYLDHLMWVFIKTGEGKYEWTLNRYRLL